MSETKDHGWQDILELLKTFGEEWEDENDVADYTFDQFQEAQAKFLADRITHGYQDQQTPMLPIERDQLAVVILGALCDHEDLRKGSEDCPDEDEFIADKVMTAILTHGYQSQPVSVMPIDFTEEQKEALEEHPLPWSVSGKSYPLADTGDYTWSVTVKDANGKEINIWDGDGEMQSVLEIMVRHTNAAHGYQEQGDNEWGALTKEEMWNEIQAVRRATDNDGTSGAPHILVEAIVQERDQLRADVDKLLAAPPPTNSAVRKAVDINGSEVETAVDNAWGKHSVDFLGVEQRSMTYKEFVAAGYDIAKAILSKEVQ